MNLRVFKILERMDARMELMAARMERTEAGDAVQSKTIANGAVAAEQVVGRSVDAGLLAWAQAAAGRGLATFEERRLARIDSDEALIELDKPLVAQLKRKSPASPATLMRQVFTEVKSTVAAEDVEVAPLRGGVVGAWTAAAVAVSAANRAASAAGCCEKCGREPCGFERCGRLSPIQLAAAAIVREHAAIESAAMAERTLVELRHAQAGLQVNNAAATAAASVTACAM